MKTIFTATVNHEKYEIGLDQGELKAHRIGGASIQIIGMCNYNPGLCDLKDRLVTILNKSEFELKDGKLQITPRYSSSEGELSEKLVQCLACIYLDDPTLTSRNLSGNEIDNEGVKILAKMLENNATMKSLNLSVNKIGNEGVKHLAAMLEKNTTLELLNLSYNSLRTDSYVRISSDLSSSEISNEGAKALAKALEKNTVLKSLNLGFNNIDTEGVKDLAAMLEKNTTLKSLNFAFNNISNESLKALLAALEKNKVLELLNLSQNSLSSDNKEAIKAFSKKKNEAYQAAYSAVNKKIFAVEYALRFIKSEHLEVMEREGRLPGGKKEVREVLKKIPEEIIFQIQNAIYEDNLSEYPAVQSELKKLKPNSTATTYKLEIILKRSEIKSK